MSKYILGKKGVIENIKKNNVINVYVKHHFPELTELKANYEFNLFFKKDNSFYDSFGSNHQFVVAELKNSNYIFDDYKCFIDLIKSNKKEKYVIVVLDEIQDAGNFGSIIRTCECFGVDGIIYKKNNQVQVNDIVIKTSAGAISDMKLLKTNNLSNVINKLKKESFWVVATTLTNDSVPLSQKNLDFDKICIIFGNEQKGISSNLISESDVKVMIPMLGRTQSLNVSVSVGIALYAINNR